VRKKTFVAPVRLMAYLRDRGIPSLLLSSEYGARTIVATTCCCAEYPDEHLDAVDGDFNADWTNSEPPKILAKILTDTSFLYWWSFA
jgi:hypothetical protein